MPWTQCTNIPPLGPPTTLDRFGTPVVGACITGKLSNPSHWNCNSQVLRGASSEGTSQAFCQGRGAFWTLSECEGVDLFSFPEWGPCCFTKMVDGVPVESCEELHSEESCACVAANKTIESGFETFSSFHGGFQTCSDVGSVTIDPVSGSSKLVCDTATCCVSFDACGSRDCEETSIALCTSRFLHGVAGEIGSRCGSTTCGAGRKTCCFCFENFLDDGCALLDPEVCVMLGGNAGFSTSCDFVNCANSKKECSRTTFVVTRDALSESGDSRPTSMFVLELLRPVPPSLSSEAGTHVGQVGPTTLNRFAGLAGVPQRDSTGLICADSIGSDAPCPVVVQAVVEGSSSETWLPGAIPLGDSAFECSLRCPCKGNPC